MYFVPYCCCCRPEKKEAKLVALAKEADLQDGEEEQEDGSSKREVKILKAQLRSVLQQPVIDPLNSVRLVPSYTIILQNQLS